MATCRQCGKSGVTINKFSGMCDSCNNEFKNALNETIRENRVEIERLKEIEKYYELENSFDTKVSGVSYKNDDGSSRQEILKRCERGYPFGERLEFKHTPIKEDKNAIKVLRKNGEQIGWLSKYWAKEIARWLKEDKLVEGSILEILEPDLNSGNVYGCRVIINVYQKRSND